MSFSKAKIQRFNDIKPCAPGPTAYNVEIKEKAKAAVLPQADRFSETKSPCISESGSTHSTPCFFRTPTLPKRKKTATSALKPKPKELFSENSDLEALKEKIVECENKDAFIKDLSEQIEELKENMSKLENQKLQLDLDKLKFEETVVNLKIEHEEHVRKINQKFEADMNLVCEQKEKLREDVELARKEYEVLKEAQRKDLEELKKHCEDFQVLYKNSVEECNKIIEEKNTELKNKENELRVMQNNCINMQNKYSTEIENLQKAHQIEVQEIEFEILKTMTELEKEKELAARRIQQMEEMMQQEMAELQKGFEESKNKLILDSELKLQWMEKTFKESNLLMEIQLKEKMEEVENDWRNKLEEQQKQSEAILKECQAISEYNIIQCEIEKNEIKTNLNVKTEELENMQLKYNETLKSFDDLNKRFKDLQCQLSFFAVELSETRKKLGKELDIKSEQLKKVCEEKRAYQVTIKTSQITIEVLKRRLIHSDKDVEQLKGELADCEEKILEYENKCLQLTSDLKQANTFNEELEMQYESTIKLNTNEIQQLKTELLNKIDLYKTQTVALKLQEEKDLKDEMMQQLHEAFQVINKLKTNLECLETINTQYEFELEQSQNEIEDYRIREMDWNIIKDRLDSTISEMENLLETKQEELNNLQSQFEQLQEKNDSINQYLEYYKNKVAEFEQELKETGNIHKKYIEQSGKYDELLQKFEQLEMENIRNKNRIINLTKDVDEKEELKKKNLKLKDELGQLSQTLEQVQKENSANKKQIVKGSLAQERLEQMETERDTLLGRINCLENELKKVSEKYADLAGHQNNKQKIKHLMDLKIKNEELLQSNIDLDMKFRAQQKSMDKLKKENSDLKKCLRKTKMAVEDKENVGSPNRSLNTSRIESPFRERN